MWQQLAESASLDRRPSQVHDANAGGGGDGGGVRAAAYVELLAAPSDWDAKITADIARTFPAHPFFEEKDGVGQQSLFNVIKAYVFFPSGRSFHRTRGDRFSRSQPSDPSIAHVVADSAAHSLVILPSHMW